MKRTAEDIQKLKDDWLKDPCFDLYDAEGFEEHRTELLSFQNSHERRMALKCPWQVWTNYGTEGWQPRGFFRKAAAVTFMTSAEAMDEVLLTRRYDLDASATPEPE